MTRATSAGSSLPLHPTYHDANARKQIAAAFKANALPSVQLQGFLLPQTYAQLQRELKASKLSPTMIADRFSRTEAHATPTMKAVFASTAFKALVKQLTGKTLTGAARIERYGHRDYTLRNDDARPPGLFVYFDCTPLWNPKWGGATIVSNEYGELARVQPLPNTLVLIDCSKAWPFVQYVNHYTGRGAIVRVTFA